LRLREQRTSNGEVHLHVSSLPRDPSDATVVAPGLFDP
jgi:hypothetical protein